MTEHVPSLTEMLLGLFFVGIPALAILWAAAFAVCKLVYEDFFRD